MNQNPSDELSAREIKLKMASELAHELRTPLGGIVGINELLLTSQLDDEQKQFSETIADSAKSMLQLLTDVVELARLDADKVVLKAAAFNPETIIEESSYMVRKTLKLHNIEWKTKLSNLPETVVGDEGCLRQILTNVILGASKYIDSGVIELMAESGTAVGGQQRLNFTFVLPPNTVNRNGQTLFYQLDDVTATVQRYDATWLRLSIVHKLLSLMKADIKVKGNTLTFAIGFSSS